MLLCSNTYALKLSENSYIVLSFQLHPSQEIKPGKKTYSMSLDNSTRLSTSNVITIFAKDSVIDNTKAGFFLDGKKLYQTWQIHSMILKEHFGMDGFIGKCNGMFIFVNFS